MNKFSDQEFIQELQRRFAEHTAALEEQHKLMKKLQAVNKKLEDSEALKSNFISNIRNEINNPFASILGLSKNILALSQQEIDAKQLQRIRSMASLINNEAFKLDFQLRNIFMAADIEAGSAIPEVTQVDILHLINEAVEHLQNKIAQKTINIRIDNNLPKDSHPWLFGTDPSKLQLILINLLVNALEFSENEGLIVINLELCDDQLKISVTDQGIGIAEGHLDDIFDRFNQLDTGLTRAHQGHGLGLSVSKALAEICEGTISVKSKQGSGSTFEVKLSELTAPEEMDEFSFGGDELFFDAEEKF